MPRGPSVSAASVSEKCKLRFHSSILIRALALKLVIRVGRPAIIYIEVIRNLNHDFLMHNPKGEQRSFSKNDISTEIRADALQ